MGPRGVIFEKAHLFPLNIVELTFTKVLSSFATSSGLLGLIGRLLIKNNVLQLVTVAYVALWRLHIFFVR